MSIFIPINRFRSRCSICNNEVSKILEDRHQQYHILGDMALSKTETACPLCLTPISIKVHNFVSHLEKFHKLPHDEAIRLNNQAKKQAENRVTELPKPVFKLPEQVKNQIPVKADERQKRVENQPQLPRGRPRVVPTLEGEDDIARERRLNRQYVQKFRNKVREQRGLPPPKTYNRNLVEGESKEERELRLNRERVRKFREAKKAQKQQ